MAVTVVQVTREVPGTLAVAQILADENLGLYHDQQATEPVTSLEFVLMLPPMVPRVPPITVYVRNESDIDLTLIEPCRDIFDSASGQRIGYMNPRVDGRGYVCNVEVTLVPGEMVAAITDIHWLQEGLQPGNYSFTTVFGAVGSTGDQPGPVEPPPVLFVGEGPNGEPADFDEIIIHINGARTFGDIFRVSLVDGSAPDVPYRIVGDAAARLPLADRDRDRDGDVDASDVQVVLSGDTAVVSIIRLFDAANGQLQFSADSNIVSGDRFALRWATPRRP